MSNTDFDHGEAASEELVLDPADSGSEGEGQNVSPDAGFEGSEADEVDGQEEVAPRRGRANDTIRELRSRAQEERAHRERLEREILEIKAAQQAARQQLTPEREAEQLALMSPEERSEYKMNKALAEIRREQALTNFQNANQADKALFDAKATTDKIYQKYSAKVESERIRYMREQNMVIPREEILRWLVGQDVLNNRGKKVEQAARRGQQNIQRQTAPLANGKGNTQASRGSANANTREARFKRLENVQI